MHFGEPLDDERFLALITPDEAIRTVITADVYGSGRGRRDARPGARRARRADEICVVGAVGHDFYTGERDGAKGFPRFTDPRLRGPSEYADYLRMATERSLERCGIDSFDLLLLHNPDRDRLHERGGLGGDGGPARRRPDPDDRRRARARPTASRST